MAYFVLKKCSVLCGIAPFQPVLRNRSKKTALRCLHDSKALKVSFILLAFSVNTFFYGHPSRKKLCCFFSFLFFCMTKCCYRKLNAGDKKAGRPTRRRTKDSAARGLRLLARISAGNHRERAVSEVVWGLPRREGRACVISHTHTHTHPQLSEKGERLLTQIQVGLSRGNLHRGLSTREKHSGANPTFNDLISTSCCLASACTWPCVPVPCNNDKHGAVEIV